MSSFIQAFRPVVMWLSAYLMFGSISSGQKPMSSLASDNSARQLLETSSARSGGLDQWRNLHNASVEVSTTENNVTDVYHWSAQWTTHSLQQHRTYRSSPKNEDRTNKKSPARREPLNAEFVSDPATILLRFVPALGMIWLLDNSEYIERVNTSLTTDSTTCVDVLRISKAASIRQGSNIRLFFKKSNNELVRLETEQPSALRLGTYYRQAVDYLLPPVLGQPNISKIRLTLSAQQPRVINISNFRTSSKDASPDEGDQ